MENFESPEISDVYRPEAPFVPFDCDELSGGDIPAIELQK